MVKLPPFYTGLDTPPVLSSCTLGERSGTTQISPDADVQATAVTPGDQPQLPVRIPTELTLPPTVTPLPPPVKEPLPKPPVGLSLSKNTSLSADVAWATKSKDKLVIWVGSLLRTPHVTVSAPRPIVQWNAPLTVLDMAVSPDHRSLAVLTTESNTGREGIFPAWLTVINLDDNSVKAVPDYSNEALYQEHFFRPPSKILGWLDNDKFAIEQLKEGPVIVSKDGTTYSRVPFPKQSNAPETVLSADGSKFFSAAYGEEDGLWIYGVDGSNPSKVAEIDTGRPVSDVSWSPDGKSIAFLSPEIVQEDGTNYMDTTRVGVWLLDLNTKSSRRLSDENVWDAAPTWSPDGTKIAFLRAAKLPSSTDGLARHTTDTLPTSLLVTDVRDMSTKIVGVSRSINGRPKWTSGGEILLSSSASENMELQSLIVASPETGTASVGFAHAPDESIEHVVVLK